MTGGASSALTGAVGPTRKAMRLRDFDYSSDGAYFITILSYRRRPVLTGECLAIIERELDDLPQRFDGVTIDCFAVLPDHLHALLRLKGSSAHVSAIVQAFKSLTARAVKPILYVDRLWHRGFYDRIVRDDLELIAIRDYILNNVTIHDQRRPQPHL